MIQLYCLAVQVGFYSDLVECSTLSPAERVRFPVGENAISMFSMFSVVILASLVVKFCACDPSWTSFHCLLSLY